MTYPYPIKSRLPLDPKMGIKSSLSKLRAVIAFIYLMYVTSGRKSAVKYCIKSESGASSITIDPDLAKEIRSYLGLSSDEVLMKNPMLTAQFEPLLVGVTLLLRLGKMTLDARSDSAERKGNKRFPKSIFFSTNVVLLDLLLKNFDSQTLRDSLLSWINNKPAEDKAFENTLSTFVGTSTIFTQLKVRNSTTEDVVFQMEGLLKAVIDYPDSVSIKGDGEMVGPTRILNSLIDEGLFPWVSFIKDGSLSCNPSAVPNCSDFSKIVATTLDINSISNESSSKDVPAAITYISELDIAKSNIDYLSAIRTKPFLLLAGISGTGKSRIVRKLAQATTTAELEGSDDQTFEKSRWELHKPENFEIIQVKPNWHNSMDVVGYQTNIPTPHYVFTPFVEFVAKAWLHPSVPFFLCLDEMNLAPVEEYFAEFLSAIESRSKKDGIYETDPIIKPFSSFGDDICSQMLTDLFPDKNISDATEKPLNAVIQRLKKKGLTLPENLIVIGTVNMDETTFSFSRKVLDRAMSFEMNEVDYDSFLAEKADIITTSLSDREKKLLANRPVNASEVRDEIDADTVIDFLKAINRVLDNTPFKLGYRAANEAMLYVAASQRFGQTCISTALDEFTCMKILSRIEGDKTKLSVGNDRTLLDDLEDVIKSMLKPTRQVDEPAATATEETQGSDEDTAANDTASTADVMQDEPQQQEKTSPQIVELKSLKKIKHMKEQLDRNSFVSYWE